MEIYHIHNVDHYYGEKHVLAIDDISIPESSIVGLIGPNGSGKSTLLKLLGFIEEPTYGSILFKGQKEVPFSRTVRSKVTLLPQEPYLLRRYVFENVAYGLKIRGETKDMYKRVKGALDLVGLDPEGFARRRWSALSGGEAQRVALAARLVLKPEVLLLDEPTASVDADSARLIRLASLQAKEQWGTTIVVVTHDWQWLFETCDSVRHLLHGRLFKGGLGCAVKGPWKFSREGFLQKELEDGQLLVAPTPPEGKEVVILDPARLKLALPGKVPLLKWNINSLKGFVSRLFLEKNGEIVQTAIKVAELVVALRLERRQVERLKLYPGKEVIILYDSRRIDWL